MALFHFVRTELEVNRGVSGGASHKFNTIRHSRETAEIGLREVHFLPGGGEGS